MLFDETSLYCVRFVAAGIIPVTHYHEILRQTHSKIRECGLACGPVGGGSPDQQIPNMPYQYCSLVYPRKCRTIISSL